MRLSPTNTAQSLSLIELAQKIGKGRNLLSDYKRRGKRRLKKKENSINWETKRDNVKTWTDKTLMSRIMNKASILNNIMIDRTIIYHKYMPIILLEFYNKARNKQTFHYLLVCTCSWFRSCYRVTSSLGLLLQSSILGTT